jgi:hypothetical protein
LGISTISAGSGANTVNSAARDTTTVPVAVRRSTIVPRRTTDVVTLTAAFVCVSGSDLREQLVGTASATAVAATGTIRRHANVLCVGITAQL